jgi:hypothetical protein
LFGACALAPAGPSAIAPRESGTTLARFRSDDRVCRGWATQQVQDEDDLTVGASAAESLQTGYDAAYSLCMSAEQAPPPHAVSTFFSPPPGLILPPLTVPPVAVPPGMTPSPGGDSWAPPTLVPSAGVTLGPG